MKKSILFLILLLIIGTFSCLDKRSFLNNPQFQLYYDFTTSAEGFFDENEIINIVFIINENDFFLSGVTLNCVPK